MARRKVKRTTRSTRKTTKRSTRKRVPRTVRSTSGNALPPYPVARHPHKSVKKYLSLDQEFEIMKLVLDKFLWLGFIIMAFGLYLCLTATIRDGLYYILAGVIILILFVWIIVKEYEVITR